MKMLRYILFVFLLFGAGQGQIYVDDTPPFQNGPLDVLSSYLNENPAWAPPPIETAVYYPDGFGPYGTIFFIGGFYGLVAGESYSDLLKMVASHGYVVVAPWPGFESDVPSLENLVNWLKEELPRRIPAQASWDNMALGCHSAGCDSSRDLILGKPEWNIKGVFMIEPFSFFLDGPEQHNVPGFMFSGELTEQGSCGVPGIGFRAFFNLWQCPRYKLLTEKFGHCDMMDDQDRAWCEGFCDMAADQEIPAFRNYLHGLMTAFYNTYVQGSGDTYIPAMTDVSDHAFLALEHAYDLCP